MAKIRVDQMGDILEDELSSYGHDVTETVKQIVKETAEDCRRDIQNRSPKKTGRYRRGWRAETVYDGPAGIRVSVHATFLFLEFTGIVGIQFFTD